MIRLTIPYIDDTDVSAVKKVLESRYLVQGENVTNFEQAVAKYVGVEHAIAVSNGTAALHLALAALDVKPNDIVLVTAYSFIATANVIELCGAQPQFIDIQPDTFNIDPECLEATIKRLVSTALTASRVKAIIPVHAFGQVADMQSIMELSTRYHIPVIEDAACALGASHLEKQAGTWGNIGCFSFHPRKAITTGEGGMITTNDPDLARKLQALRNHGQDPNAPSIDFIMPGFNYRMTDFQGALGFTQMAKLDAIIGIRRELVHYYNQALAETPVLTPIERTNNYHVYQSYVVLLPDEFIPIKQDIISSLKRKNIETSIGTWHMPLTTYFRTRYGYRQGDFPITDNIYGRSLTLPLFHNMDADQQEFVVSQLIDAVKK
jgi:perosamine synthetase